jgi:hypothetical protein
MEDKLFRPIQNLKRLEQVERRARHAEALINAALWELERVRLGESTLDELRAILAQAEQGPQSAPPGG